MIRLRVLGPMDAEADQGPFGLGPPRQRAVLALLLTARGGIVGADRMVDELWRGAPPPRALTSLHSYVSNLRRLLEPERPRGTPPALLVSAAPGYALRLPSDAVDAWEFEDLTREAEALAVLEPAQSRVLLDRALALWRGPAYAEVADEPWAVAEVARLDELRARADELSVRLHLGSARAPDAVLAAMQLTRRRPLREESWRLLAAALWASGRRPDALAALRDARRTLVEELGLDPGPALVDLEAAILAQRTEVLDALAGTGGGAPSAPVPAARPGPLVGRGSELGAVAAAAAAARDGGGLVLVSGEAGIGKSRLLGQVRQELTAGGWTTLAGRCPEADGAPPAWAWVEILRALAELAPPRGAADVLAPYLRDDVPTAAPAARFRLQRAVTDWLRATAAANPIAVLVDDLHRADEESLALLEDVATEVTGVPLLLVAAFRPAEVGERLGATLAVLARRAPQRVALGGLAAPDVRRLVEAVTGAAVEDDTVRALADRTGGNPFYLVESARLLAAEGALVATSEVPAGVRDVLRRRFAQLPDAAVAILRLAATAGREVDVGVLVRAAEADEAAVLDALEAGVRAGLLTEPAPGRVAFAHALVGETLYTDLPRLRRGAMHARLGEATELLRPDDLTGLAHHYAMAGTTRTAAAALEFGVRAAELAGRRHAHRAAARLLGQAFDALQRMPDGVVGPQQAGSSPLLQELRKHTGDRDAQRVELLGEQVRAHLRAGADLDARATRQRAIELAEQAGREDLLLAALTAWTEPSPCSVHAPGTVDRSVVDAVDRLLARPDLDTTTRCRLLDTLVAELDGEGEARVEPAGRAAVRLAALSGEPELLGKALYARSRTLDPIRDVERQARIGAELTALAREHGLPAYQWVGERIAGAVAVVRDDPASVRGQMAAYLATARRHHLAGAEEFSLNGQAALAHIEGRLQDAEAYYAEVRDRMVPRNSLHGQVFHQLALCTVRLTQGRVAEQVAPLRELHHQHLDRFPGVADALAIALFHAGREDDARAVGSCAEPVHRGEGHMLYAALRATRVALLGQVEQAPALVDELLPARTQLSGLTSMVASLRPVAHLLGELYGVLGRRTESAAHFALAERVARRWGAAHWAAAAREAAQRVA